LQVVADGISLGRLSLSVETYDGIVHDTRLGLVDPYFRLWDNFIKDRHLACSLEQNASAATSVNGTKRTCKPR